MEEIENDRKKRVEKRERANKREWRVRGWEREDWKRKGERKVKRVGKQKESGQRESGERVERGRKMEGRKKGENDRKIKNFWRFVAKENRISVQQCVKSGLKNWDRRKETQGGIYCNNIGERFWGLSA